MSVEYGHVMFSVIMQKKKQKHFGHLGLYFESQGESQAIYFVSQSVYLATCLSLHPSI